MQDADLDGLKRWSFTTARIGETKLLISRIGVTGELGFELFVPADEAATVWDALMRAGQDFGLKPYGVLAIFTLGLEKAYPAHGIDMDETRTPFHVGLDRWIRSDKGDFVGREALLKIRDTGVDEPLDRADRRRRHAGRGECAGSGRRRGCRRRHYSDHGYSSGKVLATAHLRLPFTQIGTVLSIDIDGADTRGGVGDAVLRS
ncbi:hypothetical protein [Mesorhizobium sp. BHbdii]